MVASKPIGVFDSGVGGLSVLRNIREALPAEDLIYIADSAFNPYGNKPRDVIERRCIALTDFFLEQQAKAVVVACNTATAAAIATLRSRYRLPIVGMEPAVKPAVETTRTGVIGVLATEGTLESEKFGHLLERFGKGVEVVIQPCPGLAEQVEGTRFSSAKTRILIEGYLSPLLKKGADTIVLGCTHYPFLISHFREAAGTRVSIIDTGEAVAREVRRRLERDNLVAVKRAAGKEDFWTSGSPRKVKNNIAKLWNNGIEVKPLPEAFCVLHGC